MRVRATTVGKRLRFWMQLPASPQPVTDDTPVYVTTRRENVDRHASVDGRVPGRTLGWFAAQHSRIRDDAGLLPARGQPWVESVWSAPNSFESPLFRRRNEAMRWAEQTWPEITGWQERTSTHFSARTDT